MVPSLVCAVDVTAKVIDAVERLITDSTGIMMQCNVLGDARGGTELRIAGCACVCHYNH